MDGTMRASREMIEVLAFIASRATAREIVERTTEGEQVASDSGDSCAAVGVGAGTDTSSGGLACSRLPRSANTMPTLVKAEAINALPNVSASIGNHRVRDLVTISGERILLVVMWQLFANKVPTLHGLLLFH